MVFSALFGIARFGQSYYGRIIASTVVTDGAKVLFLSSGNNVVVISSKAPPFNVRSG